MPYSQHDIGENDLIDYVVGQLAPSRRRVVEKCIDSDEELAAEVMILRGVYASADEQLEQYIEPSRSRGIRAKRSLFGRWNLVTPAVIAASIVTLTALVQVPAETEQERVAEGVVDDKQQQLTSTGGFGPAPEILDFQGTLRGDLSGNVWHFTGRVSGDRNCGLIVEFGGVIPAGTTTTIKEDKSFELIVELDDNAFGVCYVIFEDAHGRTAEAQCLVGP